MKTFDERFVAALPGPKRSRQFGWHSDEDIDELDTGRWPEAGSWGLAPTPRGDYFTATMAKPRTEPEPFGALWPSGAPPWAIGLFEQLAAALSDPAAPVKNLNASDVLAAVRFLVRNARDDDPTPWVGVLDTGGVQLNWTGVSLEAEAVFDSASGERELWVEVEGEEFSQSGDDMDSLFSIVSNRLSR